MSTHPGRVGLSCAALFVVTLIPGVVAGAAPLRCPDVATMFVTPDVPATLVWRYAGDRAAPAPLKYVVRDYIGRVVSEGAAPVGPRNNVKVTLQPARGYYDITFPATGQQFGIVAIAPAGTPLDPFFCIDGALSWLVPNTPLRASLVKVLHRCGIALVRERLRWGEVQPAPDSWQWEGQAGARGYDTLRRQLTARQVPVLEVFHDTPQWIGRVEKYPDDLVATARSWTTIARHWQSAWGALEVWNEPDIFFGGNLPADQYAALVKTLAWARRQANMKATLVGGVVAHFDPDYQRCAGRNGMLDLVDAASFHTYGRAESMQDLVGRFRGWVTGFSHRAKPLWLTECGRPWKKGPPRPDRSQGQISALDITMKAVEARACGVARYFAFVYPFYEERDNNFGMMGRAGTPLRAMAAYVQCIARLGGLDYLGDLRTTDPRIKRARVFGNDQRTVVVLYTGRPDVKAVVNIDVPRVRAEGIDGRVLKTTNPSQVPIPDGLTYLLVDRHAVQDHLQQDTVAKKLFIAARAREHALPAAAPIVVRYQYDAKLLAAKTQGYRVRSTPPASVAFTYRVFNLDTSPRQVVLTLGCGEVPDVVVGPTRQTVRVAAESQRDVTWKVDLNRALHDRRRVTFSVMPRCAELGRIPPTVISIMK